MPSTKGVYDGHPVIVQSITWLMRIFVGGLFLFSGFTKGIDVWGTIFKFNEYFSVWGYRVWDAPVLLGVFLLCLFEFLTGFFLLFGCFRKTAPVLALLIMVVMLPLTLWLAVANPISDCGCFGDAFILTNWQTFFKNVAITVGSIWLLLFNRFSICLITPYLQWIATVAVGIYILIIAWIGYYYQPLIDFRPYKVGQDMLDFDTDNESESEEDLLRFVYEKNGERKEFTIDDVLPDEEDGWVFVERYYIEPENPASTIRQPETDKKSEKSIRFYTENGIEDVTEDIIGQGRQLLLMIPVLSEVSPAKTWVINSLYEWCNNNDVEMLAAVGGNPMEINRWKDISLAEYPIYTSDDTAIEEVVRGNPGVVYLEDGTIKWKSSLRAINVDDFQAKEVTSDPMSFAHDDARILRNLSWILAAILAVLVLLSFTPKFFVRHKTTTKSPSEKND